MTWFFEKYFLQIPRQLNLPRSGLSFPFRIKKIGDIASTIAELSSVERYVKRSGGHHVRRDMNKNVYLNFSLKIFYTKLIEFENTCKIFPRTT